MQSTYTTPQHSLAVQVNDVLEVPRIKRGGDPVSDYIHTGFYQAGVWLIGVRGVLAVYKKLF